MNKEFEALKILDYHNDLKKCWGKEFNIVEQALLELKAIKEANTNEALRCIDNYIDWNCKKIEELKNQDKWVADIYNNENKRLVNIKQTLLKAQKNEKALEIIKNKNVMIYLLKMSKTADDYNDLVPTDEQLTKEEFELLKEVLKYEYMW